MDDKNAKGSELPFLWNLCRFLAQAFVVALVVPLLIITAITRSGLPEWLAGALAVAAVLSYLYGMSRWCAWSAARLDAPRARARYRRGRG